MITQELLEVDPRFFAILALSAATCFTVLFFLDSITHVKILQDDITDRELQTHRLILVSSIAMEGSLILFYWQPWLALPIFLACFITRTAHEFIDELHWHVDRCKPRENWIHLGMWVFVLIKTITLFLWGFFTQYHGVLELPIYLYVWAAIVFAGMLYVSKCEWSQQGLKRVASDD